MSGTSLTLLPKVHQGKCTGIGPSSGGSTGGSRGAKEPRFLPEC